MFTYFISVRNMSLHFPLKSVFGESGRDFVGQALKPVDMPNLHAMTPLVWSFLAQSHWIDIRRFV